MAQDQGLFLKRSVGDASQSAGAGQAVCLPDAAPRGMVWRGKRGLKMEVSIHGGTPKSSIFMGFSIKNHPFLGTPIYGNPTARLGSASEQNTFNLFWPNFIRGTQRAGFRNSSFADSNRWNIPTIPNLIAEALQCLPKQFEACITVLTSLPGKCSIVCLEL